MVIEVKDGLLWNGDEALTPKEADVIARKNGFYYAENFIESFAERGLEHVSFEIDETGRIVSKVKNLGG